MVQLVDEPVPQGHSECNEVAELRLHATSTHGTAIRMDRANLPGRVGKEDGQYPVAWLATTLARTDAQDIAMSFGWET